MALVKVKQNFQITLPKSLRKQCRIAEGDYVEVAVRDGGIFLKPVKVIDEDQAYFWTPEWQEAEAEASRDIAEGRVAGPFDSVEAFIKDLES